MTKTDGTPAAASADDENDVRTRLETIKAYRGRIMPNHAVLAIEAPQLLDTYEALYTGTTLTYNHLTRQQKKFVMLLVVGGCQQPLGLYHVKDFLAGGGTAEQVRVAARLAMLVSGAPAVDAVSAGWSQFVSGISYDALIDPELVAATQSDLPPWLLELAMAAGHACRRDWDKVKFHLVRAKRLDVSDAVLAEALTTLILTAGNPTFAQACGAWQELIRDGAVAATPAHRYAAELARG
ncbi:MAG TPA: hypothetical protein VL522_25250 [Bordetella sp.]|nr:hypothetical protein [Bordetella sp.]